MNKNALSNSLIRASEPLHCEAALEEEAVLKTFTVHRMSCLRGMVQTVSPS